MEEKSRTQVQVLLPLVGAVAETVAIAFPQACFIALKMATISTSGEDYCLAQMRKPMKNSVTHVSCYYVSSILLSVLYIFCHFV